MRVLKPNRWAWAATVLFALGAAGCTERPPAAIECVLDIDCSPGSECIEGACRQTSADAGVGDAAASDASIDHSPPTDASALDAAATDASPEDAASTDAGVPTGFALVAPGPFSLGSPESEVGRGSAETPASGTLTRWFFLGRTEVTQREWRRVSGGANPSYFQTPTCVEGSCRSTESANDDAPVERVSWWSALGYLNAASEAEGLPPCYVLPASGCTGAWEDGSASCGEVPVTFRSGSLHTCVGYRLPTEAEWEHATRAGSVTATYGGDLASATGDPALTRAPAGWTGGVTLGALAWFGSGSGGSATAARTSPVGQRAPNALGLFDTLGNVREWTWDAGGGSGVSGGTDPASAGPAPSRVWRGGGWAAAAGASRAAARGWSGANLQSSSLGFRAARSHARTCSPPNAPADSGVEAWSAGEWGPCEATSCSDGFTLVSGACEARVYRWSTGEFGACTGGTAGYSLGAYGACTGGRGAWTYGAWGTCSASMACSGSGTESRSASCAFEADSGTETRPAECVWTADSGTQARTVECRDSQDVVVADERCEGARPATTQACTPATTPRCSGAPDTSRSCTPTDPSVCGASTTSRACSSPAGVRACAVPNGTGEQRCAAGATTWGACSTTSCNAGFVRSGSACVSTVPQGFVLVPPGTFTLGSPPGEVGRLFGEDQVSVTLTGGVYLAPTEVTQGQWKARSGGVNPSCFQTAGSTSCSTANANDDAPVEGVNWWSALEYLNALSAAEGLPACYVLPAGCMWTWQSGGLSCGSGSPTVNGASVHACVGYRLPTEAEWEVAARAGTLTATYGGDLGAASGDPMLSNAPAGWSGGATLSALAWFDASPSWAPRTAPVGRLAANQLGLRDMLGNVWEWTWDYLGGSSVASGTNPTGPAAGAERVVRGGSWSSDATRIRASIRGSLDPGARGDAFGFRAARSALP